MPRTRKPAKIEEVLAKPGTVANTIERALIRGHSTDRTLGEVRRRHPQSKAGPKDVAYYRWVLRKEGVDV